MSCKWKGLQRQLMYNPYNPSAPKNLITVKELGEARRTCLAAKYHQHSLTCYFPCWTQTSRGRSNLSLEQECTQLCKKLCQWP